MDGLEGRAERRGNEAGGGGSDARDRRAEGELVRCNICLVKIDTHDQARMSTMASLRLLAPRAGLALHSKQLQQRLLLSTFRHASTSPPKPRVLEKPERFNPPSHPSRIRSKPKYYGPDLSEHERKAQRTRQYPHMMPAEGTFLHWFLTNRNIHLFISMTILVTLVVTVWLQDFLTTTPFRNLLPPNSMAITHPFSYLARWWEVYRLHVDHVSAETAERRKARVDDAEKRKEYRKAHGIEDQEKKLLGSWASEDSPLTRRSGERRVVGNVEVGDDASPVASEGMSGQDSYVDFEGKLRDAAQEKKKWFGIW
nr:hypothetical protein CFP56_75438 [Quercus suber]